MVFSSLSPCFMTLTFLKHTGHLFCRMSSRLGFSEISSWSNSGDAVLVGALGPCQCCAEGKLKVGAGGRGGNFSQATGGAETAICRGRLSVLLLSLSRFSESS